MAHFFLTSCRAGCSLQLFDVLLRLILCALVFGKMSIVGSLSSAVGWSSSCEQLWLGWSGPFWLSILKTVVKGLVNLGYDFSGARVGGCLLQFCRLGCPVDPCSFQACYFAQFAFPFWAGSHLPGRQLVPWDEFRHAGGFSTRSNCPRLRNFDIYRSVLLTQKSAD